MIWKADSFWWDPEPEKVSAPDIGFDSSTQPLLCGAYDSEATITLRMDDKLLSEDTSSCKALIFYSKVTLSCDTTTWLSAVGCKDGTSD